MLIARNNTRQKKCNMDDQTNHGIAEILRVDLVGKTAYKLCTVYRKALRTAGQSHI